MKKQKLAVCVLSAALMIGAATLTSYAAEGWQQSGNSWIYVDNNGNKVTNTWKKGADNLWRYLDSQGNIASNCWVDDEYFVESTGIMATDKWLKLPKRNPAWNETSATTVWYYFSTSGKMVSDGWSKIGGKYYYMMGKYLTQETRVKYTTTAKVTYRSGAGTKYASKGTLAKGSTVQIVKGWSKKANGYTWYKLRQGNSYYYVVASYLKKAESVTMYTAKSRVYVRSGAGTNRAIVASLAAKTPVAVINGRQTTVGSELWQMVKINTKYYYILGSYLQK